MALSNAIAMPKDLWEEITKRRVLSNMVNETIERLTRLGYKQFKDLSLEDHKEVESECRASWVNPDKPTRFETGMLEWVKHPDRFLRKEETGWWYECVTVFV